MRPRAFVLPLAWLAGCVGGGVRGGDDARPVVGHDTAPDTEIRDSADPDPETIPDTAPPEDTDPPEEIVYDEPTPDVLVDCAGGGDYATIAAAIAAVPSGTRIGLALRAGLSLS